MIDTTVLKTNRKYQIFYFFNNKDNSKFYLIPSFLINKFFLETQNYCHFNMNVKLIDSVLFVYNT